MSILSELPNWVQSLIMWLSTGSNIAALFGIIAALIKLGAANKESKSVTNLQINLLQQMITKLSDTRELASAVQSVSAQVSDALSYFEKGLAEQQQANANLATFIMECFSRSNLSDETKAELKIMADKIFYNDNMAVIEKLKQAKLEADAAVAAGAAHIAELEMELAEQKQKLITAQENVRANRRL